MNSTSTGPALSTLRRRIEQRAAKVQSGMRRISLARLAAAALALLAGWAAASGWLSLSGLFWASCILALAAFVALLWINQRWHLRWRQSQEHLQTLRADELRTAGRLADIGAPFTMQVDQAHPSAGDLNLLGSFSLHQYTDRCATASGRSRLAELLISQPDQDAQSKNRWQERKEAIRQLSRARTFRQRFRRYAAGETDSNAAALQTDIEAVLFAGDGVANWWRGGALALCILFWSLFILYQMLQIEAYFLLLIPLLSGAYIAVTLRFRSLAARLAALSLELTRADRLFKLLESYRPSCEYLRALTIFRQRPAAAIRELAAISGQFAFRRNPLLHFLSGLLYLHELHAAARWRRWRQHHSAVARLWFQDLALFDALQSLAGVLDTDRSLCFPEWFSEDESSLRLQARQLSHPLIVSERRVGNDIELGTERPLWLLTGSNMSGKSTLLRSIGANLTLAMCGAPVAASSFRFRPLFVWSSMQQQDNLASSVSLFYAEVQRLRLLLEAADRAAACALLLIDEMLRGTNARERTAASRIILERLLRSGASCILATHDLDLAAEAASRTQFYSCHFEETIKDGRMSFDYLLRPGPVASGNALRILELEGVLP